MEAKKRLLDLLAIMSADADNYAAKPKASAFIVDKMRGQVAAICEIFDALEAEFEIQAASVYQAGMAAGRRSSDHAQFQRGYERGRHDALAPYQALPAQDKEITRAEHMILTRQKWPELFEANRDLLPPNLA